MRSSDSVVYTFEEFRLDPGRQILSRGDESVSLPPKAFEILLLLVESEGRTVSKNELMEKVWPDTFVEENNLTVNMTQIRKALGEKRGENRFVVTVPGRGYRFAAAVQAEKDTPHGIAAENKPEKTGPAPRSLRVAGVFLVVVLVIFGVAGWLIFKPGLTPPQAADVTQVKKLAVLPFTPFAASEQDSILGMGMADALITKLSGIRRITVRPTSAIAKYAVAQTDPITAGRDLDVEAVLDGKIQRSGDALRISVQLIRVADNAPLWAESFDTRETDLFALQDSISAQVAESLALKLNDEEKNRIARHSTNDPEAYKLYLNGVYQLNKRTLDASRRSVSYFDQAIEKQPDYALAYAGLGDAYVMLGNQEALLGAESPNENIPKAKAALKKALSLDSSLAEAHASYAWVSIWETGDIVVSQEDLRRALELKPDLANAHNYNALLLMIRGRFDEALAEVKKAQEIDQFSLIYNLNIGTVLFRAKRYDEAEAQCRRTLELDPNFARSYWLLGLIDEARGKYPEAIVSLRRSVDLSGDGTLAKASLAHALAKSGNRAEAEKILLELTADNSARYTAPDSIAMVYGALGEKDKAFTYLEKALADRPFSMLQLEIEQRFDDIRQDPRFKVIVEKMKEPRE